MTHSHSGVHAQLDALLSPDPQAMSAELVRAGEMAFKKSEGKLRVEDRFEDVITSMGMTRLPVDARHAAAVAAVALPHRDPLDQLLVAQAQVDGLRLLTADAAILSAGLPFVIDARM